MKSVADVDAKRVHVDVDQHFLELLLNKHPRFCLLPLGIEVPLAEVYKVPLHHLKHLSIKRG